MIELLTLFASLAVLCIGTEISVRTAVAIADGLKISPVVIGLTIVAFGTDLPELIVAIRGALNNLAGINTSGLIVGNAIGSSVCQISLVAGVIALCVPMRRLPRPIAYLELRLLGSVVLLFLVSLDGKVTRIDGAILTAAFLVYLVVIFVRRHGEELEPCDVETTTQHKVWRTLPMLAVGLALVMISAEFVIKNALIIAEKWEMNQSVVGAVIIAVGTSLPELAISAGAALRRQPGLSIGNLVGSNVFDCLIPIGVAALISEVEIGRGILLFDLPYLLVVSALFIVFVRRGSSRLLGSALTALFVGYAVTKSVWH